MATSLVSTGVQFPDSTIQTTAASGGVDIQVFNSSGTWTKPSGKSMCRIQVWAGGGGGGRSSLGGNATGGGGGAYNEVEVPISYMGATATVTVGAAGQGRTGSQGAGTTGGTSSVPMTNWQGTGITKTVAAYGGGPGFARSYDAASHGGGGGGGVIGAGAGSQYASYGGLGVAQSANPYIPQSWFFVSYNPAGPSYGPSATTGTTGSVSSAADPTAGGHGRWYSSDGSGGYVPASGSVFGGGGGGMYYDAFASGGSSLWGGGGGVSTGYGNCVAGTSQYGGNGGQAAAGQTPAGGGGYAEAGNADGYNGGAGRVIIISW